METYWIEGLGDDRLREEDRIPSLPSFHSISSYNPPSYHTHEESLHTIAEDSEPQHWISGPIDLDNLEFLRYAVPGEATLTVILPDGTLSSVEGLNVEMIANRCPLLALSFEAGELGQARAGIDAPSRELAVCFLRFLYTGDYLDGIENCSLLLHAQLCKMAEIYEVVELQVVAHANVLRETEMSCSRPTPPKDLCEAIRFIFTELSAQRPLLDTLLHYCVSCFLYHGLGMNEEFKKLTFELRQFTQELCRTSFHRGFEDDGAIDIVRLQTCHPTPCLQAEETRAALGDFLFDFHNETISDTEGDVRAHFERGRTRERMNLARRPKEPYSSEESEEETHGFTLVHRPKQKGQWVKYEGEADKSASENDSDYDMADHSPAKKLRVTNPGPEDETEGLADSFCTIKPSLRNNLPVELDRKATADENSDSEWSLV